MKLFAVIFLFIGTLAQAEERKLVFKLSLPFNQNLILDDSIRNGGASVRHEFRLDSNGKSYEILAEVWGFAPGHTNRVAGYVSFEQVRDDLSVPPNYAINHCELKSYKEACNLELVAVLNGVGAQVVCKVNGLLE